MYKKKKPKHNCTCVSCLIPWTRYTYMIIHTVLVAAECIQSVCHTPSCSRGWQICSEASETMHKTICSCKQCAAWLYSQLSVSISLIFNSCQTGIFGRWLCLNSSRFVYFAWVDVGRSSLLFSREASQNMWDTRFAVAPSPHPTALLQLSVNLCVYHCMILLTFEGILPASFSCLSPAFHTTKTLQWIQHTVQTCPLGGATHTYQPTHCKVKIHTMWDISN